jgi:hypothetical protein
MPRTLVARPRRAALACATLLIVLGCLGLAELSGRSAAARAQPAAVPSTSSTDPAVVPYYVVRRSTNGQREYLFDIAVRTLGDGNRYMEIFELNRNRLEPGGQRLEDAAVLASGWVLQLPPDAYGPDVVVGRLPVVAGTDGGAARATAFAFAGRTRLLQGGALLAAAALLWVALRILRGGRARTR